MTGRFRAVVLAVAVVLAGCRDDGAGDDASTSTTETTAEITTTTSSPPETGGIDVPDVDGTYPVAVPSLGFGIAVPEDWQATLLSEDALRRLEGAQLAEPFFLEAAQNVAATGAVFYAAGVDEEGQVSELKIDVQSGASTDIDALRLLAEEATANAELDESEVVELEDGRIRVDYQVTLSSAEDGEPIRAYGSQLFVPDGDRLFALIVTSEQEGVQRDLLDVFQSSFVVG